MPRPSPLRAFGRCRQLRVDEVGQCRRYKLQKFSGNRKNSEFLSYMVRCYFPNDSVQLNTALPGFIHFYLLLLPPRCFSSKSSPLSVVTIVQRISIQFFTAKVSCFIVSSARWQSLQPDAWERYSGVNLAPSVHQDSSAMLQWMAWIALAVLTQCWLIFMKLQVMKSQSWNFPVNMKIR